MHVPTKTVWVYDSGAHFGQLKKKVQVACKQMQLFGKSLNELLGEPDMADEADIGSMAATVTASIAAAPAASSHKSKAVTVADTQDTILKDDSTDARTVRGGDPEIASGDVHGADEDNAAGRAKYGTTDESPNPAEPVNPNRPDGGSKSATADKVDVANDAASAERPVDEAAVVADAAEPGDADMADNLDKQDRPRVAGKKNAGAVQPCKKKRVRTNKGIKTPVQTESTICGPFSFSFLRHQAREIEASVLSWNRNSCGGRSRNSHSRPHPKNHDRCNLHMHGHYHRKCCCRHRLNSRGRPDETAADTPTQ